MGAGQGSVRRSVRSCCEHLFVKSEQRLEARRLRREHGLPLNAIATRLKVSKSSVSRWVRDITLTEEQSARLEALNPIYNAQLRGRAGRAQSARLAREAAQLHGREAARRGETLHAQGCMLYRAEGTKSRNSVLFTNSDAEMHAVFLRFLRDCYHVTDDRIALSVNCFAPDAHAATEIVRWWLRRLCLPGACARAPTVNHASRSSRGRRGHVLPHGTARLAVHSTFIVQSIYGGIQEYAGVARPEWLELA
jgi:transcriptional regulator with XRE-family HTH domain